MWDSNRCCRNIRVDSLILLGARVGFKYTFWNQIQVQLVQFKYKYKYTHIAFPYFNSNTSTNFKYKYTALFIQIQFKYIAFLGILFIYDSNTGPCFHYSLVYHSG